MSREMGSWGYRLSQQLFAPGATHRILARVRELADAARQRCALDVGCGPVSWLSRAGLDPFGVDRHVADVRAMCRHGGTGVAADGTALPFPNESFFSVWSFGLLHHLSDADARRTIGEILRVTCRGGLVVIFDGVWPVSCWHAPAAWLIRACDRGAWMRRQHELEALLGQRDWYCERFTYAWTGLEGMLCWRRKSPS